MKKENNTKDRLTEWRSFFSDLHERYTEAGCALKGLRYREELTQKQLADKLGIKQSNLSKMENGKTPIGKTIAKRIANFFGTDYRIFL